MKKIIFVYGSIAGAAIIGSMILGIYVAQSGGNSFFASEALGYSIMLIGFSMIFVATKKYRDEELGGVIKFGAALKIGLGISLIAGIVYVITWEVNLYLNDYQFITDYTDSIIRRAQESGASPEKMEAIIRQMEEMKIQYGKLWYRLPMTFTEIFPIGLLISLISAVLFRNSNFWKNDNVTSSTEN